MVAVTMEMSMAGMPTWALAASGRVVFDVCHGVCFLQSERAGVLEWRMGQVQRYVSEVQAKVS